MLGENLCSTDRDRLDELLQTSRFHLKRMYRDLAEPKMFDVRDEYDAQLLDQGEGFASVITRAIFRSQGPWIGKAFRPINETTGEGYNAFGDVEDRQAKLPMDTYIGHSLVADGQSFILDYRAKNWGPIRWLRGEVRQVSDSILLGLGTFGPRSKGLHKLRRVIPFVMVKSDRPYLLSADNRPAVQKAA